MNAIELLKASRAVHIQAAKNRLEMCAALAGDDRISPVQAAIDADKYAFTAGVLDQILAACGEK